MKHFKKITFRKLFIAFIVFIFVWLVGYIALDWSNIQIDRYNFEQLEKAKPILESIPATAPKFYTLKEFNQQYNANIQPLNNCYYVSNYNWKEKYIFWFQLKSNMYKFLYWNTYTYPKYSLPTMNVCTWECYDHNANKFKYITSNPCKD